MSCLEGLVRTMSSDKAVKPKRASLTPAMEAVKRVALEADTFGYIISGSRPIVVVLNNNKEKGREPLRWLLEDSVVAKW